MAHIYLMDTEQFDLKCETLLLSVLDHVPFDGWTASAIATAAEDCKLGPAFSQRAFPRGAIDAIDLHNKLADRNMVAELSKRDAQAPRVRDIITAAIRIRLQQNTAHREAIRRALPILALPQNISIAARCLRRTVNIIWYAAGDTATDHNFYTKRALLSGVYSSTLLCWLNDRSEDQAATWEFLDRRISEVMSIPKLSQRLTKSLKRFPNPFSRGDRIFGFRDFGNR